MTRLPDPRLTATELQRASVLARQRGLKEAAMYLGDLYDPRIFEFYAGRKSENGRVKTNILPDNVAPSVPVLKMEIDVEDRGIARQLAICAVHERASTRKFVEHLSEFGDHQSTVTVLEFGGNIGYYSVIEAAVLGDAADINVVEPHPENIELLQRNLAINGYEDTATVTQGAISDESGSAELVLQEESNLHSIGDGSSHDGEKISVPSWTANDYLSEHDIDPADVDVVRMDVEGHEWEVINGFDTLAELGPSAILFIEIHDTLLENGTLDQFVDRLRECGFELTYGCNDHRVVGPTTEFDSLDDLPKILAEFSNAELFLQKS